MGYQLWTSPVTGYRRRGTRLIDFNAALGQKILVSSIFEPLKSCPADAPADEMKRTLQARDFDIAGVKVAEDSEVIGFIQREQLVSGVVRDHLLPISPDSVIDDTTTIHALLEQLKERPFVFVRVDGRLDGILTLADLNKPVVRVFFFGLISLLEIHLGFWVQTKYSDEIWQTMLGAQRVELARSTQAERERRGQKLQLLDCLQFSDKHELVIKSDELRENLALGSKKKARQYLSSAEKLRNILAHSQYDLVVGSTWADLIGLVQRIETTISASDDLVEARAIEMAQGDLGSLW